MQENGGEVVSATRRPSVHDRERSSGTGDAGRSTRQVACPLSPPHRSSAAFDLVAEGGPGPSQLLTPGHLGS